MAMSWPALLLSTIMTVGTFGGVPTTAQAYPLCPLTGLAPQAASPKFTRCLDANTASCCTACSDIRYGLGTVTASVNDMAKAVVGSDVEFLPPGSDLSVCQELVEFTNCTQQIEQMTCAAFCSPDSGNIVTSNGDGTYTISLCSAYAATLFDTCSSITLAGLSITRWANNSKDLIGTLFKAYLVAAQLPTFVVTVAKNSSSSSGCYGGPKKIPELPLCCDPLVFPSGCPASVTDVSTNLEWAVAINRTITNATCLAPTPLGNNTASGSTPNSSSNSSAGLCPLTGLPPTKPNVTFPRCPAVRDLACCSDCTDLRLAFAEVSGTMAAVASRVSSSTDLDNGGALQLCSMFAGHAECEHELEQMVCAVVCSPDSGRFIKPIASSSSSPTAANGSPTYTLAVCDSAASMIYNKCKDLYGTNDTLNNTKEDLVPLLFGRIASSVQLPTFTTAIVKDTDMCYNGSTVQPALTACCDPLAVPAECSNSTNIDLATYPEFRNLSGRRLDPVACGEAGTGAPVSAPLGAATAPPQGKSAPSQGLGLVSHQAFLLAVAPAVVLVMSSLFFGGCCP